MRKKEGQAVSRIILPAIDGKQFDSESLKGKPFLLSFFRFATCPFCNLRMHMLTERFAELGREFTIVAVFDAPAEHLRRHAGKHHAPFPVLADAGNRYYREFGVEHSFTGMLKGMITRLPTLMKGIFRGYIPFPVKGSLLTMPADFLIDENGMIRKAFYAKDEGDHLPFEEIKAFALQGRNDRL